MNKRWKNDPIITNLPNGLKMKEYSSGNKYYYLNGHSHREDWPAIEWANGNKTWCINGEYLSCETQEEFERLMRLKAFW